MPDNSTFDVQGYIDNDALPFLHNKLGVTRTLNRSDEDYSKPLAYGTRGDVFAIKKPTRLNAETGLTFDSTSATDGSFTEQVLFVTADQLANSRYAITDVEGAVYNVNGLLKTNPQSALDELANKIDAYNAEQVAFAGYRAFGDFNIQSAQNSTVGEVTQNIALFQSFGCARDTYYVVPMGNAAQITQSGLQQFVMKRNEEIAVAGEIGELNGAPYTKFLATNLLPVHIAGTAADDATNFLTGYTIDSVNPTPPSNVFGSSQAGTTEIVLTGGTDGTTIVENDMIDIGFLNTANPLRFLTYRGYIPSEAQVQGRVTSGGTFASGTVTITIEPALIFDSANADTNRNLNRPIIPGTDTLRIAASHRAGAIYEGSYGYFVSPALPMREPYPTGTKRDPELQISMRAYYGAVFDRATKYFVHDVIYGFGAAPEGFGRILLPI